MATTTYLKLTKPASEHDAQKVATYNAAVDELDGTTAGFLLLSVAGSSNVTLTRTQGLNKLFKFTGALTGNISVLFPAALGSAREFVVWNATTGAYTLTVKTTAGGSSGVAVTQGTKTILAHDDTDVFAAAATGGGGTTINATNGVIPYRSSSTAFADSPLARVDANTVKQSNGVNNQELRVYGADDGAGNADYLRLAYSDSGTVARVQSLGTGTGGRQLQLWGANYVQVYVSYTDGTGGTRVWYADQTPTLYMDNASILWSSDNAKDIGASGANRPRTVYIATKAVSPIVQYTSFTVSTLPTPTAGMTAYVTDGDAGLAWGATVVNTGAGATKYLVWYNGTNWTVMGK